MEVVEMEMLPMRDGTNEDNKQGKIKLLSLGERRACQNDVGTLLQVCSPVFSLGCKNLVSLSKKPFQAQKMALFTLWVETACKILHQPIFFLRHSGITDVVGYSENAQEKGRGQREEADDRPGDLGQ